MTDLAITHADVSKGKTTRVIAADYWQNTDINQVMAIEDGPQGIAFRGNCGLLVAMGNGHPSLKRVAHREVASVYNDGVAEAIEIFALHNAPPHKSRLRTR